LQACLQDDFILHGELTIYCSVTAIFSILPQLLGKFRKAHPKITIHIQTGDAAKALQKLHNHDVDLVIAALPNHQPAGVDSISLLQTPLVFIISKSFRESVAFIGDTIDIGKTPVILPTEGLSRIRAEEWFTKKHIKPNIYAQVSGNEAIIALVSIGCGIGIVPLLVLEKSSLKSEVEIIPLTPNLTPFTVGVCALKKNRENKILQSFWEIIVQQQIAT
jgi:LysR family transcriptional regulator, positive regulator for ilvC